MKRLFIVLILLLLVIPSSAAEAKYAGKTSGWVPWFALSGGMESAMKRVEKLDTVYLFVYEIDHRGQVIEKADLKTKEWENFLRAMRRANVEIIPTVAWFDGAATHEVLSNRTSREAHIAVLTKLVRDNDYDGIDLDYEQKLSETIHHFSTFLRDLKVSLGRDTLVCTIEPRTPPDSLWRNPTPVIDYANDYTAINQHCDRIQIMAYDQQRADIKLNDIRRGVPYAPVADKDWVEKVLQLALKDFDKDKVYLGIPTYGRAWDVTVAPEWYRDYKRVASLNQPRIKELSAKYASPIGRSAGGEAVISYFPEDSIFKVLNQLPVPPGTPKGYEAAAKALFFASATKMEVPVRFVSWSDGPAVRHKVRLAEKYGLAGVAIFKIDGEEDQRLWTLF